MRKLNKSEINSVLKETQRISKNDVKESFIAVDDQETIEDALIVVTGLIGKDYNIKIASLNLEHKGYDIFRCATKGDVIYLIKKGFHGSNPPIIIEKPKDWFTCFGHVYDIVNKRGSTSLNFESVFRLYDNQDIDYVLKSLRHNLPNYNVEIGYIDEISVDKKFLFWLKNISIPSNFITEEKDMDIYVKDITKNMSLKQINNLIIALNKKVKSSMTDLLLKNGYTQEQINTLKES